MEHFNLCKYVILLFRQFFNATINYYMNMICPHIIVLMMDGMQHFKTFMLLPIFILVFSAFLFLGAGTLVSSLAFVFEKFCFRK